MVYRKLGRTNAHRKALLRNLVTSLIEHESIITTHAKAKEAQAAAERLITLAKEPSANAYQNASAKVFKPDETLPKLFGELAQRYADRPGGYTRVLKLEPRIGDNAPQSILELVGGRRDMKQAMTARVVARLETVGQEIDNVTAQNVADCIKASSEEQFRADVEFMKDTFYRDLNEEAFVQQKSKLKSSLNFVEKKAKADQAEV